MGNCASFFKQSVEKTPMSMSTAFHDRYGADDNVHCMMRTHKLKADFIDCMAKFQACGGVINNETTLDLLVDVGLRNAANNAHEGGRSVGDHPACTELFDAEMYAKVLGTEQVMIDKYNLGTCCSSDSHM